MRKSTFDIYPAEGVTITVRGNKSAYLRDLQEGNYACHHFEVVNISSRDAIALCRRANDRGVYAGSWHAHCNGYNMDIVYSCVRPGYTCGVKRVCVNTWANYRRYTK